MRLCLAGALLMAAAPAMVRAQSPGIAALMQGPTRGASRVADNGRERHARREARPRAHKPQARVERIERSGLDPQGRAQASRLSVDERRRLRQTLYELSREVYSGGG